MANEKTTPSDHRRHGIWRPAALAAVAVLSLNMIHASAWASPVLTTVAGGGNAGAPGFGGDGGKAIAAQLNSPAGVAVDGAGNVFVADTVNQRIRRIDAAGVITTIAGGAKDGAPGFAGDGEKATAAQLNRPSGVAVDGAGNVFVADTVNQRVRRIDAAAGVVTTIAGGAKDGAAGFSGDGGRAIKAQLNSPSGVAVDGAGNVFVADTANQRVRRIDAATGVINTVAGGAAKSAPGFGGDGGPGNRAQLSGPSGVAVDGAGNILIADTGNQRVRRIENATGVLTTIAGGAADGAPGFGGDGGPATAAQLKGPAGVAVDGGGNVIIADTANQRVRRIDAPSGTITTLAGGPEPVLAGPTGDPATPPPSVVPPGPLVARGPLGVAVDRSGAVLIANSPRNRIDKSAAVVTPPPPDGAAVPPAQPADPASLCRLVEEGAGPSISTTPAWMTRSVSVSTPTATPGQELGVQGNGFGSGQELKVTLCSVPTVLGSVVADPGGTYRTSVKIPADAAPGAHHLVLSDASGNAAVALRVVLPSRGGTGFDGGAGADQGLSDTGATGLDDPSQDSTDTSDLSAADQFGADPGGVSIGSPDIGSINTDGTGATDANGMPITGGEFTSMIFLAGASLKVGGALVLAGRKRTPRR